MGRKRKKTNQSIQAKLSRPWCFYCDRDFKDEKVLRDHQRAKHFKCIHQYCNRGLGSAAGLAAHMLQVHKEHLTSIPNAKPERDTFEYEIVGMEGIPEEYIIRRQTEIQLQASGGNVSKKQRLDNGSSSSSYDGYDGYTDIPPPSSVSPPPQSKSKGTISATPVIYTNNNNNPVSPPVQPPPPIYGVPQYHPPPPQYPFPSQPINSPITTVPILYPFPSPVTQPPPPPPTNSPTLQTRVQPPPPPPPTEEPPVTVVKPPPPPPPSVPLPPQQETQNKSDNVVITQKTVMIYDNEDVSMEELRAMSPKYKLRNVGRTHAE